ncbi:MAG: NifB/NifX family molybdenum-iron cluster-binding protein [Alphaproteobacteria bacterium]|nr:NifB/NifX family molybdenum-iron cluster-binding protein [Alphaproteobacteria bacterium]
MKIALTSTGRNLEAPLDARFGRCAQFLIYDTDNKDVTVLDNKNAGAAQGAGLKAAETVVKAGASVVITGACGPKAFVALKRYNVAIFAADAMTGKAALEAYQAGTLSEIASA